MLTRANIIDHMLATMGEGGVSTLNTLHPSVQTAKAILDGEDLDLQGRGWWFNTERKLLLTPDNEGRLAVPQSALGMIVYGNDAKTPIEKLRYVKRGGYIYDAFLHTNVLNCSLYVDVVVQLEIEDLPHSAASFLKAKSAETMYVSDDGDQFKTEKLERTRMEAWQRLKADELKTLSTNALDNQVAANLLSRSTTPIAIYGGGTR